MTIRGRKTLLSLSLATIVAAMSASVRMHEAPAAAADPVDFLVVRRTLQVSTIHLNAVNDVAMMQREGAPVKISDTIALINPAPTAPPSKLTGMLILADGQRFPGEPADTAGAKSANDAFAWNHAWLGRIDVPLKLIQSVALKPDIAPPQPGSADAVVLGNGDRYDGFITALGNPVSIEVDQNGKREVIDIPLDRVASVTMITPKQQPKGRRIWFGEGTVLDVQSITVGEDGAVHLTGSNLVSGTQVTRLGLGDIAAVMFDSTAMLPLATIAPSRIEGPTTRYVVPKPRTLDVAAALDLSRIEFRGPIVVRYALPAGCQRLAAEASLPSDARAWGDYELVIRSDDAEVFRTRLNAASPTASINVQLTGRELTIELTQGARGPIQDDVVLTRAMLLRR